MPGDKTTERLSAAEDAFRALVLAQYDLEADFVNVVCGFFRTAAEPLCESAPVQKRGRAAGGSAPTKAKKTRNMSAYNVFVREMMKTTDVQKLDHKEKMGAIAAMWKGIGEDSKVQYVDMAKSVNDATATASPVEDAE